VKGANYPAEGKKERVVIDHWELVTALGLMGSLARELVDRGATEEDPME